MEQPAPIANISGTTAFDCGGGGDNPVVTEGWIIRGCSIRNVSDAFGFVHGFTPNGRGVDIYNNIALNLTNSPAFYVDSWNMEDMYVHDNQFINCANGVLFNSPSYTYTNLVFANNIITCQNGGAGFQIGGNGVLPVYGAIRIEGNVVKPHEQGGLCYPLAFGTPYPGGFQLYCDNNIFESGTNGDPGGLFNDIMCGGSNILYMDIVSFKNNHNLRDTPLTMGYDQTWDYMLNGDYDEDLSFIPTNSGWYKIFSSIAAYTDPASGRINIWSKDINNTGNDVDLGLDFELSATGYGILNQSYNDAQNDWNLIPQARLAAYSTGNEEGFEIYVASALVGQKINLHVSGLHRPPLAKTAYCSGPAPSTQSVNASASVVLNVGPGIATSGAITGGTINGNGNGLTSLNASQITSGTIPSGQLPIVPSGKGGLGLDASTWTAGLIPYTIATGTFGSTAAGTFGVNLLGSINSSAALSALGLPSNPSVILTSTNIGAHIYTNNIAITSLGAGGTAYLSYTNAGGQPSYGFSSSTVFQGGWNNVFGDQALANGFYCAQNEAFGDRTLEFLTNGVNNIAIGSAALMNITNGAFNVAVGSAALLFANGSQYNTALGVGTLQYATNTEYNTAVGCSALENTSMGNNNIGVGYFAGSGVTTGNNNIEIGNNGLSTDNGVIRIGSSSQTDTYLAGVIHAPMNVVVSGTLAVSNGISSTLSNTVPASKISISSSPFFWTNTTPENLAIYINGVNGSVGYNGSLLFGPISGAPATVILQPGAYVSVTNSTGTPVLNWHPL